MAFPASGFDKIFRNNIDEVFLFLYKFSIKSKGGKIILKIT